MVDLWSSVLKQVPGSRLMLVRDCFRGSVRRRFVQAFVDRGVEPDRLVIHERSAGPKAIYNYQQMDIALDPYPYAGHTTTCEALWMGVPVVTLTGPTMVTRMSASVLTQIGQTRWIATDPEQYVQIAAGLAREVDELARRRAALREQMSTSPLGQPEMFTRHLEDVYRDFWRQWCTGAKLAA